MSPRKMFNIGVRYFHVHLEYSYSQFYVTNTILGPRLDNFLWDLLLPLVENKDEFVILHIEKCFHRMAPSRFDYLLYKKIYEYADFLNITLYAPKSDGVTNLADVTYAQLLAKDARLIVVYDRPFPTFWLPENSLDYLDQYMYSLTAINSVINNRDATDRIRVVKGAITTNFTAHVEHYTKSSWLHLDLGPNIVFGLQDNQMNINRVFAQLKESTNLKNMILSVDYVDREIALFIIKRNGDDFIIEGL